MSSEDTGTRQRILEESLRLLEDQRGKNVRMSDIAKAAGISRQAVYLHFKSQTELMIATVRYGDDVQGAQSLVEPWRKAKGIDKLDTWIEFWGNYIPKIFGVAKALMIAKESNEVAAAAWDDRMEDVRKSCRKTIQELSVNNLLSDDWTVKSATDMLWTMLSIQSWEQLTSSCGWSSKQYVERMKMLARSTFVQ
jgi:AcrR family transcriptional regulator